MKKESIYKKGSYTDDHQYVHFSITQNRKSLLQPLE